MINFQRYHPVPQSVLIVSSVNIFSCISLISEKKRGGGAQVSLSRIIQSVHGGGDGVRQYTNNSDSKTCLVEVLTTRLSRIK